MIKKDIKPSLTLIPMKDAGDAEVLAELFFKLTGKRPTQEEIDEGQKELDAAQKNPDKAKS